MTLIKAYAAFLLILLVGCAALGIAPADTWNKKVIVAYASVEAAYDLGVELREAGKLDDAERDHVVSVLDGVMATIDGAVTVYATDPTLAENRLQSALTTLNLLDAYLRSRK